MPDIKEKIGNIWKTCRTEIKRTTNLGQMMLEASQINSELKEYYERLGRTIFQALDEKSIVIDENEVITKLQNRIGNLESKLNEINLEVKRLKSN